MLVDFMKENLDMLEADLLKSKEKDADLLAAVQGLRKNDTNFGEKYMKDILEGFDDGCWLQHGDIW